MAAKGTKAAETTQETSKRFRRGVIHLTVQGLTPLLMDAMPEEDVVKILIERKRENPKTDITLYDRAYPKVYRDDEGNIAIPSTNCLACLREAGRFIVFDGRTKVSTADTTLLFSFLNIEAEHLRLRAANGNWATDKDWKPDVRRGMMESGAKKIACGIVRPKFAAGWSFDADLVVDLSDISVTEQSVRQLVGLAGKRVGLLSFRPRCNGPFGQFTVTKWEAVEATDSEEERAAA